jgi:hypothetical protein
MKILPVGAELSMMTDGRIEGHMTKLKVALRNFANTPKNVYFISSTFSAVSPERTSGTYPFFHGFRTL